jgi:hypothetical protein
MRVTSVFKLVFKPEFKAITSKRIFRQSSHEPQSEARNRIRRQNARSLAARNGHAIKIRSNIPAFLATFYPGDRESRRSIRGQSAKMIFLGSAPFFVVPQKIQKNRKCATFEVRRSTLKAPNPGQTGGTDLLFANFAPRTTHLARLFPPSSLARRTLDALFAHR